MKKTTTNKFTLLEIVICLAILGTIASVTGWGVNTMVGEYRFNQSIKVLLEDLKKNHLICLADRIDMEFCLIKKDKGFEYFFRSDEPLVSFRPKPKRLKGVKTIQWEKQTIDTLSVPLFSSGRIGYSPIELTFLKNENKGFILDLKRPHQFKCLQRS